MLTIDAQVHAYERNHPGRPWAGVLHGPPEVTGKDMVAAMDAVGVDGAVLVSPFSMYRYDASYALEVYAAHPGRFGLVKPVDPADPAVADTIADWAATDGTVGIRIMLNREGRLDRPWRSWPQSRTRRRGAPHPAGQSHGYRAAGAGRTTGSAQPQYVVGDRSSRAATAVPAASSRGAVRRSPQAAGAGAAR